MILNYQIIQNINIYANFKCIKKLGLLNKTYYDIYYEILYGHKLVNDVINIHTKNGNIHILTYIMGVNSEYYKKFNKLLQDINIINYLFDLIDKLFPPEIFKLGYEFRNGEYVHTEYIFYFFCIDYFGCDKLNLWSDNTVSKMFIDMYCKFVINHIIKTKKKL